MLNPILPATALLLLSLPSLAQSSSSPSYKIAKSYTGKSFEDEFNYFTDSDPTGGYVNYVSKETAKSEGLIDSSTNVFRMGVDSSSIPLGRGRDSVRISSKDKFADGIYILDLAHIPVGCGTWPAFWTTTTTNWPAGGEIDILEGANALPSLNSLAYNATIGLTSPLSSDLARRDTSSLHTSPGCSLLPQSTSATWQTGTTQSQTCDASLNGNQGCGILYPSNTSSSTGSSGDSLGAGFNRQGGGWYAMHRDLQGSGGIYMYFWGRGDGRVPDEVRSGTGGSVSTAGWGMPVANFSIPSCKSDFNNHVIVFNIALCGDYTAATYTSTGCPSSCPSFTKQNPSAFAEAYFEINSLRVYTASGKPQTEGLAMGTLIGVVVGSVVGGLLVLGLGGWWCVRRRRARAGAARNEEGSEMTEHTRPTEIWLSKKTSDESISTLSSRLKTPATPPTNSSPPASSMRPKFFNGIFSFGRPRETSSSSPRYNKSRNSFVPQLPVKRSGPTDPKSILPDGRINGETDALGRLAGETVTVATPPAFVDREGRGSGSGAPGRRESYQFPLRRESDGLRKGSYSQAKESFTPRKGSYANPMGRRGSRVESDHSGETVGGSLGPSWMTDRKPSSHRKPSDIPFGRSSVSRASPGGSRPTSGYWKGPTESIKSEEGRRPSEVSRGERDRRPSGRSYRGGDGDSVDPFSMRRTAAEQVASRDSWVG